MSATAPVVLVGLPGSGKSTVAPLLATALGIDSSDLDDLVQARSGSTIPELFSSVGEEGFRRLESESLAAALGGPPAVIATGGGVVTHGTSRAALAGATVLWLRATPTTLAARIASDRSPRPLLDGAATDEELMAQISDLADSRAPLYDEVATAVVDVDDLDAAEACEEALRVLASVGVAPAHGATGALPRSGGG